MEGSGGGGMGGSEVFPDAVAAAYAFHSAAAVEVPDTPVVVGGAAVAARLGPSGVLDCIMVLYTCIKLGTTLSEAMEEATAVPPPS